MKKTNRDSILLIVRNSEEVLPALVSLNSIAERYSERVTVRVFFAFDVSPEILNEFEKLATDNIIVLTSEMKDYKGKDKSLSILLNILLNFEDERVLYISNSCLAIADFKEIFQQPDDKILYSKYNKEASNLDENIILFNVSKLKELALDHLLNKEITNDMWYALMYQHNGALSEQYNCYIEDYKNISAQALPNIKFICYSMAKPWENLEVPFGFLWWKYARKSVFYEKALTKILLNSNDKELNFSNLMKNESDTLHNLIKTYLKEAFLYLFTFGRTAQNHKSNLSVILQKIHNEISK